MFDTYEETQSNFPLDYKSSSKFKNDKRPETGSCVQSSVSIQLQKPTRRPMTFKSDSLINKEDLDQKRSSITVSQNRELVPALPEINQDSLGI